MKLSREFFNRNADVVARDLLGKMLVFNNKKGKIVETEAYFDENDPASRACQNGDLRNTMNMDAGTILVYGVHNNWLINIVTGEKNKAEAVLIRAIEPLNFDEDTKGPGLLTKALGIGKELHKSSVGKEFLLEDHGIKDFEINSSYRVGVKKDLRQKLRFYIKGNMFVSK
ncbi:MAG: DNA-3-methyladenine glycosylase [Nanoarchaeota archaeon]